MLRFSQDVSLSLKEKDRKFSFDFLKGLCAAGAIHFILLFGIKICTLSTNEKSILLSPVKVEIDLGAPTSPLPPKTESFIVPSGRLEIPFINIPVFRPLTSQLISIEYPSLDPDFSDIESIDYQLLDDFEEET